MLMKKICFKKAYTMAEIVTAMIVIGIIIGVTLNITRAKIERADKYTYYAAYTALSNVASEILVDSSTGLMPDSICSELESRLNLSAQDITINGTAVTPSCSVSHTITSTTDFSLLTPNMVARNGMKFYNASTGKVTITQLANAATNDTTGFIVYVDVDGVRSNTVLYQDVFPFYITTSGKVIPAYPTSGVYGGNSTNEMVFSVRYDEITSDAQRIEHWLVRSVSFKEAACKSGYIAAASTYCTTATAYTLDTNCDETTEDCILVPIQPIKYSVK